MKPLDHGIDMKHWILIVGLVLGLGFDGRLNAQSNNNATSIVPVPEGMQGISGLISAVLLEKDDERGDVVFEVERIHRLWPGNKATNARSGEGKTLRLKGITGRALDQLLLIEAGDRFSIEVKHVRGDHLVYLGEGLKKLNEGELPAEGLGKDNRSFMHGFRGIFIGELLTKDPENGTFSVKIESIKRVWKANKAIQASLADGQVWEVRGVSGKWVDVLLEIEVGEKIEAEAFHNSGDKLDFVGEWLRRPER
jgi:hypothetical protein